MTAEILACDYEFKLWLILEYLLSAYSVVEDKLLFMLSLLKQEVLVTVVEYVQNSNTVSYL